MRRVNPWTAGLLSLAFASAGVGLVTAQEAELPAIPTPPEESTAEPAPPTDPDDPAAAAEGQPPVATPGVADPAPYTVLGPDSRRAEAEAPPPPPPAADETLEEALVEELPVDPGPPPPLPRRPRHAKAIVQAADKVTAETMRFEVDARRPVRWKSLVFRISGCETEAANEPLREATAHMTVTSEPRAQPGRVAPEPAQVFRGWMFASSPGLNPFEHPVYDAWLVGCSVPPPVVAPGAPGAAPPVPGAPSAAPLPRNAATAAALRPAGPATRPG